MTRRKNRCNGNSSCFSSSDSTSGSTSGSTSCSTSGSTSGSTSCSTSSSCSGKIKQKFIKARGLCGEPICVPYAFIKEKCHKKKNVTTEVNNILQQEIHKKINVIQAQNNALAETNSINSAKKIACTQAKISEALVNMKLNSALTTALNTCGKTSEEIQGILQNDVATILTIQGGTNQKLELAEEALVLGCPPPTCPPPNKSICEPGFYYCPAYNTCIPVGDICPLSGTNTNTNTTSNTTRNTTTNLNTQQTRTMATKGCGCGH